VSQLRNCSCGCGPKFGVRTRLPGVCFDWMKSTRLSGDWLTNPVQFIVSLCSFMF